MNQLALLAQQAAPMFTLNGRAIVSSVITLIIFGLIFWLLWWLIQFCGIPEPFNKVAKVVLAIAAVLLIIGVLLSLVGYPLIGF